ISVAVPASSMAQDTTTDSYWPVAYRLRIVLSTARAVSWVPGCRASCARTAASLSRTFPFIAMEAGVVQAPAAGFCARAGMLARARARGTIQMRRMGSKYTRDRAGLVHKILDPGRPLRVAQALVDPVGTRNSR